jgi:multicomponent Na+:H+ antiporter subunit C
MLTAIVVGVSSTAVGLALVVRVKEAYDTVEEDEIVQLDRDDDMAAWAEDHA